MLVYLIIFCDSCGYFFVVVVKIRIWPCTFLINSLYESGHEVSIEVVISHSMHGYSYGEFFVTLVGTKGQSEELKFSQ